MEETTYIKVPYTVMTHAAIYKIPFYMKYMYFYEICFNFLELQLISKQIILDYQ